MNDYLGYDWQKYGKKGTVPAPMATDVPDDMWGAPKWLEKMLDAEPKSAGRAGGLHVILDHLRHYKDVAFADPYGFSDEDAWRLMEFCSRHKLRWSVIGESPYFPGYSVRVVIWQPQGDMVGLREVKHWIAEYASLERGHRPISGDISTVCAADVMSLAEESK